MCEKCKNCEIYRELLSQLIDRFVEMMHSSAQNTKTDRYDYIYVWGNNAKRRTLKGRRCRIVARGTMNSIEVEFENGKREIISGNAIRKKKHLSLIHI